MAKRVGILTGGGDCPGLNAVIRAVVRRADALEYETLGILEGWKGLLENKVERLDLRSVSGILCRGGTILRTSRTNPLKRPEGLAVLQNNLQHHNMDALIAVGGDDTMSVADRLFQQGVRVMGIPKTIDNDLTGTDYCFGFDTAVNIATEAIDRLHTTAESHNRIMVVEVMGRDSGWIAVASGMAGGADAILIPERPVDVEQVCALLRQRHERGKDFSIVVVAEGVKLPIAEGGPATQIQQGRSIDEFGHAQLGGVGSLLANRIEASTGFENPRGRPGASPARRKSQRFRPHPGYPLRGGRHELGSSRSLRQNGRAAGDPDRSRSSCGSLPLPSPRGSGAVRNRLRLLRVGFSRAPSVAAAVPGSRGRSCR